MVQPFIPIQMRAPCRAASGMIYALGLFPNFFTARAPAACRKSIPPCTAGTLPVRLTIGLPITFGAANFNIIHKIKILQHYCIPVTVINFCLAS